MNADTPDVPLVLEKDGDQQVATEVLRFYRMLAVDGISTSAAGRKMGWSHSKARYWQEHPSFTRYVQRYMSATTARLVGPALNVIESLLDAKSESVRLQAASALLKYTPHSNRPTNSKVSVTFDLD